MIVKRKREIVSVRRVHCKDTKGDDRAIKKENATARDEIPAIKGNNRTIKEELG